jgi:hypothetical protein
MQKKIFSLITALLLLSCSSTIQTTSQKISSLKTHKNIAILPFKISFASKLRKTNTFTDLEIEELKRYMSIALQGHLYQSLKTKQKRFPYTVNIQSSEITNSIFSSQKISFAEIFGGNKSELCKILGVDAVIFPQAIFGKQTIKSINEIVWDGAMAMYASISDSTSTVPLWTFNNLKDYKLKDNIPANDYSANDKYQAVIVAWATTIDEMYQSFTADFPYKKK